MNELFGHIAVCVDNSDASQVALDEAWRLHTAAGAGRLTIVHVIPSPMVVAGHGAMWLSDPTQVAEGVRTWLDELVGRYPGAEAAVLDGHPAIEACHWAGEHDVDLIVASASRGLFDRVLLGSFAGYLARHAPCPVLLTRPHVASADRNGEAIGLEDTGL